MKPLDPTLRISPRFRLALLAKALLLVVLAAAFAFMAYACWSRWHWGLLARWSGAVLLGVAALSLLSAASRGLVDAVLGQAVRTSGARPLKSRRSGYSLRLPDGRFVEYVLYNPWPALEQGQTYTVTYGRFSRVMVEPPVVDQR